MNIPYIMTRGNEGRARTEVLSCPTVTFFFNPKMNNYLIRLFDKYAPWYLPRC
jgi:hypothetical protein